MNLVPAHVPYKKLVHVERYITTTLGTKQEVKFLGPDLVDIGGITYRLADIREMLRDHADTLKAGSTKTS